MLAHGQISTLYAHMARRDVGCGAYVTVGQPIGTVGSTGNSTGPHLHFEILVNGASDLRTLSFDIVNGQADVEMLLGLATGDLVKIERIDFFDSGGDRFATLGVRIQSP